MESVWAVWAIDCHKTRIKALTLFSFLIKIRILVFGKGAVAMPLKILLKRIYFFQNSTVNM
jgi:hypothetical protein